MAVLEFLTEEFHKGKQYSILNSYRSSISMTHVGVKGIPVGKLPIVSRFMILIWDLPVQVTLHHVSVVLDIMLKEKMNHFL